MTEEQTMNVTAKPLSVQYDFYLDFAIEGPEPFYDFFATLREAGPDDLIFIHINSPGGSLSTCVQVINAINLTQATVVGCAEGDVASAAAYIFFSCHAFQLADHCSFLIHSDSGGFGGKISDVSADVVFTHARMKNLMKDTLGQFFSKKEIRKLLDGREHYLSSEEVADRISKAMEEAQEKRGHLPHDQA